MRIKDISKKIVLFLAMSLLGLYSIVGTASAYNGNLDGICVGGYFICVIIWFVIAILIALWVYKDAEKRGKSGVLWLLVVLVGGIIGIIIWLIVRPPLTYQQQPPPPSQPPSY